MVEMVDLVPQDNTHGVVDLSHSPPIGHDPDDASGSSNFSKLELRTAFVSKNLQKETT